MHLQIITIYCLCDAFLQAYGYQDDNQTQMSNAEVMTTVLVAAQFFAGNQELSRLFLKEHAYIPTMLSKSRLNRRLHALPEALWQAFLHLLGQVHQQSNPESVYIVDSMPIPACDNIRITRCRLYHGEAYRGYIASKRRYFYGLKIHLVVTATGRPIEVVLRPGADNDLTGAKALHLDLLEGSELDADRAYNDYAWEDLLREGQALALIAQRKNNSTRPHPGCVTYLCQVIRKRVETTFSQIAERLPRSIHAVTPRGFELKVFLTVLVYAILA